MRKFLISIICALCVCSAFAAGENIATSKAFVDTAVAQKQDKISANSGTAQVLTNTGSAGTVGTKDIYTASGEYANQTAALVDAQNMNAAVQNAIDTEFECIQYDSNNECLLVRVVAAAQLPSGYTALRYLESAGKQYIDLGMPIGSTENITAKFVYLNSVESEWFGASDGNDWRSPKFTFSQPSADPLEFMVYSTANTNLVPRYYTASSPCVIGTPYIINWYGNPYKTAQLYPNISWARTVHEVYTPTRNAYLFDVNYPGFEISSTGRSMRIYYFRVEGKLDLIPARRDSDGVLGMYDLVSGTFLTNSGTGNFIAGPMIYMPSNN